MMVFDRLRFRIHFNYDVFNLEWVCWDPTSSEIEKAHVPDKCSLSFSPLQSRQPQSTQYALSKHRINVVTIHNPLKWTPLKSTLLWIEVRWISVSPLFL